MNHDRGSQLVKSSREVKHKEAELASIELDISKHEEDILSHERRQYELNVGRCAAKDADILEAEMNQPKRDDQSVITDVMDLARNNTSAPLVFLEACAEKGWFSPQQLEDFVGLAAMLARVEDASLNRVLAEYLGIGSLCLIVTRTQLGIRALEATDSSGEVDESKGLHHFAHSQWCSIRRYDAIALSDVTPFVSSNGSPAVITEHHQRLLNIPPPILPRSSDVPGGFLGYAVNLLYLKPEHLQMRVDTKTQRQVGLRESLWFHMLQFLQVYDTRENMVAAKERLERFEGGAISLDGGLIRPNNRQQIGIRPDKTRISFGLVPMTERLVFGGLMPLPCLAIERQRESLALTTLIQCQRDVLSTLIPKRNAAIEQLEELRSRHKENEKQLRESQNASKLIAAQMAMVQRAAQRATPNGETLENETSASLQCGTPFIRS